MLAVSDGWTPRIDTEVTRRHMLANILIVDNCVTELIRDKLFAVKRGAAHPSVLKLDVSSFCVRSAFRVVLTARVCSFAA